METKEKGANVRALFIERPRNTKVQQKKIGSQIERWFAVSHDDQFRDGDAHAVVLITTSQLFNGEGIIINAISEAVLETNGQRIPIWPK